MMRNQITIFYFIFIYVSGLLIRFATSDGSPFFLLASSLMIDTVLSCTILAFGRLALAPLSERLSIYQIIPVSLVLAALTAFTTTTLIETLRFTTSFGPDRYFENYVVFSYFTLLVAIYNLQFLWLRHANLAEQRRLEVANAEHRAAQSELRRLRTQMQPHFLFNVLNNIKIEIGNSPAQASEMISVLSEYLRQSLSLEDTMFVTLAFDVESVQSFVRLQQMRFGTNIHMKVDITVSAAEKMVPAFLLLPLIENATKFGDRAVGGELIVNVAAWTTGEDLNISVSQLGSLSSRNREIPGTRTGLANLRSRIGLHYPDRHSFNLSQDGDHVRAQILLRGDPC